MKIIIKLNKNKKKIICYDCDKSDYYKNQCFNLIKNANHVTLNEIKLKKKINVHRSFSRCRTRSKNQSKEKFTHDLHYSSAC